MHSQTRLTTHARVVLIATAAGLLAGSLVGAGAMGSFPHAKWPVLAGIGLGMVCSLAAPGRKVLVAFWGSGIAVVAAVTQMVSIQVQRGHWPITDEFTAAHYGTTAQAILRATVLLGILIVVPCLVAAVLVAVAQRRHPHPERHR